MARTPVVHKQLTVQRNSKTNCGRKGSFKSHTAHYQWGKVTCARCIASRNGAS